MKKIMLTAVAVLLLACTVFSFAACSPEAVECDEHADKDNNGVCDACGAEVELKCAAHKDENGDKLCDLCSVEFFPRCSQHTDENANGKCDLCGKAVIVEITVSLCDQEGAYIPGVTVIFTDSEYEEYVFVTDTDGKATVELYTGNYRVTYDTTSEGVYFPEGYLPIPSNVTVTASNRNVTVQITKTVPNGEASRPFPLSSETNEIEIPAATKYHYIIYHASGRKIRIEGTSFEVVYNDSVFTDSEGKVNFVLEEAGADEHSFFTIENKSDSDMTLTFSLYSDPGTHGNPYIIEELGAVTYENLAANGSIYYKWVADKNGKIVFSTEQIYVFKTKALSAAYPMIKISGEVNSHEGVYSIVAEGVEYTITVDAEAITIVDTTEGNGNISGTYSYTLGADEAFVIETSSGAVAPFTLYRGGRTIVVTNRTNSRQANISGNAEQTTIDVEQGDELIINISSVYLNDFTFELDYFTEQDNSDTDSDADNASESFNEDKDIESEEPEDTGTEGSDDNNSVQPGDNDSENNTSDDDTSESILPEENGDDFPENYIVGTSETQDACKTLKLTDKTYTTDVKAGQIIYFKLNEGNSDYVLTVNYDASDIALYAGSAYLPIAYYTGVEIEVFMADSDFYIAFENTSDEDCRFEFSLTFVML